MGDLIITIFLYVLQLLWTKQRDDILSSAENSPDGVIIIKAGAILVTETAVSLPGDVLL